MSSIDEEFTKTMIKIASKIGIKINNMDLIKKVKAKFDSGESEVKVELKNGNILIIDGYNGTDFHGLIVETKIGEFLLNENVSEEKARYQWQKLK